MRDLKAQTVPFGSTSTSKMSSLIKVHHLHVRYKVTLQQYCRSNILTILGTNMLALIETLVPHPRYTTATVNFASHTVAFTPINFSENLTDLAFTSAV
jgi:hypothetical protein